MEGIRTLGTLTTDNSGAKGPKGNRLNQSKRTDGCPPSRLQDGFAARTVSKQRDSVAGLRLRVFAKGPRLSTTTPGLPTEAQI